MEWEQNGVIVDETEYYNETADEFYGGLRPGGFVTSTEVKRNPIRPASFLGFKPSSLDMEHGDSIYYSDVTGDTDNMGEEGDTKETLAWEQNGVIVDESFVSSTDLRPASFLGFKLKPSSLDMENGDYIYYSDSDVTVDTDVMGEEDGDTKESLEWEHNGVTVDESQDYRAFGYGSFLTSTGVKRNPIRPASFSPSTSPSSLGSSFTCSPMTEARRMRVMDLRRIIGEREVRASSFDMYRSLWHFATSL